MSSYRGGVMTGRARRRRARAVLMVAFVLLMAGFGVLAARALTDRPDEAAPEPADTDPSVAVAAQTAQRYLTLWETRRWGQMQRLISDRSLNAAAVHKQADRILQISAARFTPGPPVVDGDTAAVPFAAEWDLRGLGTYRYDGELRLARVKVADPAAPPRWRVRWWYSTVHPDLTPEARFERIRRFHPRAAIIAADGKPLRSTVDRVDIGIEPQRLKGDRAVIDAFDQATDVPRARVAALLRRDDLDSDGFYKVLSVRSAAFAGIRPQLEPVPGIVFQRHEGRVTRFPGLASDLLGSVGEITAEELKELGSPYRPGDLIGRGGLEGAFERQLAGEPMVEASIVDDVGLVRSLKYVEGTKPEPVRTTLVPRLQRAAEAALSRAPSPAALVAIDVRTGGVRAVVSTPEGGFRRALVGQYPPGSTFKVVTAAAVLDRGMKPGANLPCPASATVGGRRVNNSESAGYGTVSLKTAFAKSCNTTFSRLGVRIGPQRMREAAERFGFNREPDLGLPAVGGDFPLPDSGPDLALASIGQARVLASPLQMASVAATAAAGQYRPPVLVRAGDAPKAGAAMKPAVRSGLAAMMRAVVTSGTGTAARVPGQPVAGKTGTAEYGEGGDQTHAWFIGSRGSLAFAVVVEGGGYGGAVAAPIARDFLD